MVKWVFIIVLSFLTIFRFILWRNQLLKMVGQTIRATFIVSSLPAKLNGITFLLPPFIKEGDQVVATGELEKEGLRVSKPKVTVIGHKSNITNRFSMLRGLLVNQINRYLPADEAALAVGLLLGGSSQMSQSLQDAYRSSGLIHLVAASGFNVTMAAAGMIGLLALIVNRRLGLFLGIGCIWIYVLLAGGTASVVRAGIMVSLALIGNIFGRAVDARWLLLVTALLMWLSKPDIIFDIGWQLSLSATAGLVFFKPKNVLSTSVAAQLTTLPLILHYFGNLSLVAPLANVSVAWAIPLAMYASLIVLILGPIGAWIAWPILKFINLTVSIMATLPGASFQIEPMSWWWVIGFYIVLILVWRFLLSRKPSWAQSA